METPPEELRLLDERYRVIDEFKGVQRQLADINLELKTTWPQDVFRSLMARKKAIVARYQTLDNRLTEIKKALREISDAKQADRDAVRKDQDWHGTLSLAQTSFRDLVQYVRFLELQVARLSIENEQLRGSEIEIR